MQSTVVGIGRLLLGAIFLIAGAQKVVGWQQTLGYMQSKGLPTTDIYGYPALHILLGATIALEIIGGLMVITGFGAKTAAVALAALTIAAAIIFHDFWTIADPSQYVNQFNHFMKNIAIAGGLLVVAGQSLGEDRYNY